LIVDDRAVNRELLVTLLGYGGHRLLEAADGCEALAIVRVERPDLVIADVLMPKMDGYELVRRIREEEAIAHTRVIFCTAAYYEAEARRFAKACGVLHLLIKPVDPQTILQTVATALDTAPHVPASLPSQEFNRTHRQLLMDKLAHKVVELEAEVENRKRAEMELKDAHDLLEQRVVARTAELRAANEQLEKALREVKTLTGLLPICAGCKDIRDAKGNWQRLETFIMERSSADFSHGLCPHCIRKLYPELADTLKAGLE